MNVYDFDGTIYEKDSTLEFYKYALKHSPRVRRFIFTQFWGFFLYVTGFYSKTRMKERFHSYLSVIDDAEALTEKFWDENISGIRQWYIDRKRSDDVVISASPDFIVLAACKRVGVQHVIATKVDPLTGRFLSENNLNKEKVRRFQEQFGKDEIEEFFSDSLSDEPMANVAKRSYFVRSSGDFIPWEEYKPSFVKRMKSLFLQREFIMYVLIGFVNAFNGVLFAWLLSYALQANAAYVAGYFLAVIVSFFLNSLLTFKKRPSFGRFWRFCLSYCPSFVIQNLSVLFIYNGIGAAKIIAYIAAAVLGIPLTFLFMKIFAFRK